MRKTKLVALLLAIAMIASMVVPSVSAEDVYTISALDNATGAATIDANAGDTITVKLVLSNNPGVSSVAISAEMPEGWTLSAATNKKLFNDYAEVSYVASKTKDVNPYVMTWAMGTGTSEGYEDEGILPGQLSFDNGVLATLKYEIPADAATGTYTIKVSTEGREADNVALKVDSNGFIIEGGGQEILPVHCESLTVNVQGTEPEVPAGAACPEHPEVTTWTDVAENAWAAGGALTSGHYKLTGNQATTAALTVAEGETVCIDLNGYNITAGAKVGTSKVSYRVFTNNGTLAILDSTAAEGEGVYTAGTISGGALKTQGDGGDNTYEGACGGNILNAGTFTLVDGIIADG